METNPLSTKYDGWWQQLCTFLWLNAFYKCPSPIKILHMQGPRFKMLLLFAQGCAGKRGYIGYKGDKVRNLHFITVFGDDGTTLLCTCMSFQGSQGDHGADGPRGIPGPPGPPGLPVLYLWRNTEEDWAAFKVGLNTAYSGGPSFTRLAICAIFTGHVLARISVLPKIFRFWLCFPVSILAGGNDRKVVWPITCRHCT